MELEGKRIVLRELGISDVSEKYVGWLNDPEVNRYLETRFETHTPEMVRDFVQTTKESPVATLFGIFLKENGQHIGNIKLGPINIHHLYAPVSLFIGEKSAWGHGYATEAIGLVTSYGFKTKGLQKLEAGCYKENIGSQKAFEKCGFSIEGRLKSHFISENKRTSTTLLGLAREDWKNSTD